MTMTLSPTMYKDPLLGLYYLTTLPLRRRLAAERAAEGTAPTIVLFYHRVADDRPNDWTIPIERFQAQVAWLRRQFEIVSLTEAQQRIGSDVNRHPAVCITFDDGYADNCRTAIPWLIRQEVPFTYFVTSAHVLEGLPFAHDVARGCPLAPNTADEIRAMAAAGVEIGAHTRRHADLAALPDESALEEEIAGSKHDLEAITGRPVRYFAFPFGQQQHLSTAAFRVAFRAGFWGVCSAYGGYNLPGDDPFHIHRIHGDPGWARFCNWMTADPRKYGRVARFNAGDYRDRP
ncbi:MAG: polysaccharide deacetylase family protein [Pirellulales bacterium]|nr:polysaccharide deacetylase family protein [Pirellulales bacterium]